MLGIVVTDNFDFEIIAEFHLKVMEEYTRAISKGSLMMPSCLKRTDLQMKDKMKSTWVMFFFFELD